MFQILQLELAIVKRICLHWSVMKLYKFTKIHAQLERTTRLKVEIATLVMKLAKTFGAIASVVESQIRGNPVSHR